MGVKNKFVAENGLKSDILEGNVGSTLEISIPAKAGTNVYGTGITIKTGAGTGVGTSGDFKVQIAKPSTSGSTVNALTDALKISGETGNMHVRNSISLNTSNVYIDEWDTSFCSILNLYSGGTSLYGDDFVIGLFNNSYYSKQYKQILYGNGNSSVGYASKFIMDKTTGDAIWASAPKASTVGHTQTLTIGKSYVVASTGNMSAANWKATFNDQHNNDTLSSTTAPISGTKLTAKTNGNTLVGTTSYVIQCADFVDTMTLSPDGNLSVIGDVNVSNGKTYKINNVDALSSTTLGTSVVNSSLTKVGLSSAGLVKTDANGNLTVDTSTYLTSFTDTLQSIADNIDNSDKYITFVTDPSGAQTGLSNSKLKFNPSTGLLKVGGDIELTGTKISATTSGNNLSIRTATSTTGESGKISISGGNGVTGSCGGVDIYGGDVTSTTNTDSQGGLVVIKGGSNYSTNGWAQAGGVQIAGGQNNSMTGIGSPSVVTGGYVNLTGGSATAANSAIPTVTGSVYINGGGSTSTQNLTYGSVYIGTKANDGLTGTSSVVIGKVGTKTFVNDDLTVVGNIKVNFGSIESSGHGITLYGNGYYSSTDGKIKSFGGTNADGVGRYTIGGNGEHLFSTYLGDGTFKSYTGIIGDYGLIQGGTTASMGFFQGYTNTINPEYGASISVGMGSIHSILSHTNQMYNATTLYNNAYALSSNEMYNQVDGYATKYTQSAQDGSHTFYTTSQSILADGATEVSEYWKETLKLNQNGTIRIAGYTTAGLLTTDIYGNIGVNSNSYSLSTHNHTLKIGDGTNDKISYGTNERLNIVGSGSVSITYDDTNNKITISGTGGTEADTLQTVTERTNGNTTNKTITLSNTTTSTSSTTGALIVSGGVGIGGNLNIAGNLNVNGVDILNTLGNIEAILQRI